MPEFAGSLIPEQDEETKFNASRLPTSARGATSSEYSSMMDKLDIDDGDGDTILDSKSTTLSELSHVRKLRVTQILGPRGAESLGGLISHMRSLERLDLDSTALAETESEAIDTSGLQVLTTQIIANVPTSRLCKLSLANNNIDCEGARMVSKVIQSLRTLECLNLSKNIICEAGAKALGKTLIYSQSLRELNLASNNIRDRGAAYIGKAIGRGSMLRKLNLAENFIFDEGARQLSYGVASSKLLRELVLSGNQLGLKSKHLFAQLLAAQTCGLKKLEFGKRHPESQSQVPPSDLDEDDPAYEEWTVDRILHEIERKQELQKQLATAQKKFARAQKHSSQAHALWESSGRREEEANHTFNRDLDKQNKLLKQLEHDNHELEGQIASLESSTSMLKLEASELVRRHRHTEVDRHGLDVEFQRVTLSIENLKQRKAELQELLQEHKIENDASLSALAQAKTDVNVVEKQMRALDEMKIVSRQQETTLKLEIQVLEGEIAVVNESCQELRNKLEILHTREEKIQSQLVQMKITKRKVDGQIEDLRQTRLEVQAQLDEALQARAPLQQLVITQEKNTLQAEQDMRALYAQLEQSNQSLRDELAVTSDESTSLPEKIQQLGSEVARQTPDVVSQPTLSMRQPKPVSKKSVCAPEIKPNTKTDVAADDFELGLKRDLQQQQEQIKDHERQVAEQKRRLEKQREMIKQQEIERRKEQEQQRRKEELQRQELLRQKEEKERKEEEQRQREMREKQKQMEQARLEELHRQQQLERQQKLEEQRQIQQKHLEHLRLQKEQLMQEHLELQRHEEEIASRYTQTEDMEKQEDNLSNSADDDLDDRDDFPDPVTEVTGGDPEETPPSSGFTPEVEIHHVSVQSIVPRDKSKWQPESHEESPPVLPRHKSSRSFIQREQDISPLHPNSPHSALRRHKSDAQLNSPYERRAPSSIAAQHKRESDFSEVDFPLDYEEHERESSFSPPTLSESLEEQQPTDLDLPKLPPRRSSQYEQVEEHNQLKQNEELPHLTNSPEDKEVVDSPGLTTDVTVQNDPDSTQHGNDFEEFSMLLKGTKAQRRTSKWGVKKACFAWVSEDLKKICFAKNQAKSINAETIPLWSVEHIVGPTNQEPSNSKTSWQSKLRKIKSKMDNESSRRIRLVNIDRRDSVDLQFDSAEIAREWCQSLNQLLDKLNIERVARAEQKHAASSQSQESEIPLYEESPLADDTEGLHNEMAVQRFNSHLSRAGELTENTQSPATGIDMAEASDANNQYTPIQGSQIEDHERHLNISGLKPVECTELTLDMLRDDIAEVIDEAAEAVETITFRVVRERTGSRWPQADFETPEWRAWFREAITEALEDQESSSGSQEGSPHSNEEEEEEEEGEEGGNGDEFEMKQDIEVESWF